MLSLALILRLTFWVSQSIAIATLFLWAGFYARERGRADYSMIKTILSNGLLWFTIAGSFALDKWIYAWTTPTISVNPRNVIYCQLLIYWLSGWYLIVGCFELRVSREKIWATPRACFDSKRAIECTIISPWRRLREVMYGWIAIVTLFCVAFIGENIRTSAQEIWGVSTIAVAEVALGITLFSAIPLIAFTLYLCTEMGLPFRRALVLANRFIWKD